MIVIDDRPVTLADIDEALSHIREMLQDRYGNRLTHQRKQMLLESIDDLLDYRLQITLQYIYEHREGSAGLDPRISQ